MKRHLLPLFVVLPLAAQEPGPRPRGEGPEGRPEGRPEFSGEEGRPQGPPPMMPLLEALDLNHDHLIDEKEIAAAVASLKTLDGNGDGKIDEEEFRPRPHGEAGGPEGGPRPQGPPAGEGRGGVPQGNAGGGGAGGERRMVMPVIGALDLNRDGKIDPEERAKATASLKVLDKDGDGELSDEEMRPLRAPGGGGGQPGGGQGRPGAGAEGRPGGGGAGPNEGGRPVRPAAEE